MLPLYEAKMIHHYDTRWATYEPDGTTRLMTEDEKAQHLSPMPRYWVHEAEVDKKLAGRWDKNWFLGWRDICRATDARTVIATQLPRVAVGHKILLALPTRGRGFLQATLASFAFDYVARQKIGGTSMTYFTVMQLPVPKPKDSTIPGLHQDRAFGPWVELRVDRLNAGPSDHHLRVLLSAELDAAFFHVYGVSRDDADYILETFPIVKRKDLAEFGEYRTKRLILRAYDAMADAIRTGTPYHSPFGQEALS